jgi:Ca-activated chloride channel family protein
MIVGQVSVNTPAPTSQTVSGEKEIGLAVTVRNKKGQYIRDLRKEDFNVLIGKTPQKISHLASEDAPVSVGILIDTSGSVRRSSDRLAIKRLNVIRDGLARFVSLSNPNNEYFLLGFSRQPEVLVENTRDGRAVADRIPSLELKGYTALIDACYEGVEKVARATHRKRAVILVSDGDDTLSKRRPKELERLLKETDVTVYSICIVGIREHIFQDIDGFALTIGKPFLVQVARHTGGVAFFPSEETQVKALFEMIALDLRSQYRLVIRPEVSGKRDKWQALKVNVTMPATPADAGQLIVRTREGFYPSAGLR